uniref:Uncharacterized protein n=1 Tax=Glossina palpalis gambiensis TaxID=67801 RepID=A0A1B0BS35_9MUSC
MKLLYIGLVCRILAFSLAKPLSDDQTEPVEDESTVNGRVLYDQRQSGKYNIHIIIKDVAIIEMDQNEIVDNNDDGDYYYDEEDLTIKPLTLNLSANKTATTTTTTTTTAISSAAEAFTTTIRNIDNEISTLQPKNNNTEDDAFDNQTVRITNATFSSSTLETLRWLNKVEPSYSTSEPLHQTHAYVTRDASGILQAREADMIDERGMKNAKLYKIKLLKRQPIKVTKRLCRSNQFRDASGACRSKKAPTTSRQSSGSILKRVLGMLISLPFAGRDENH